MYTWADSKTHQKRIEEITNQDKLKFKNRGCLEDKMHSENFEINILYGP